MVEAAGVEPASGSDQRGASPCAAPLPGVAGRHATGQSGGPPAPWVSPEGPGRTVGLSRCSTSSRFPAGEGSGGRAAKQPARTGCWRLVTYHLFNEAAETSARFPSFNTPVETVSPPPWVRLDSLRCGWTTRS